VQRLGVVVDPRGYIVAHGSLASLTDVRVTLDRYTSVPARVVTQDDGRSLVLLKIDAAKPLPHVSWGEAAASAQDVVAVYSEKSSSTSRILAVDTQQSFGDRPQQGLIQLSLSVDDRELGLPLFQNASLVGITILSVRRDGATMTYAQPVDAVRKFVEQALKTDVQR
jgi:S1-C subfamily serine protease